MNDSGKMTLVEAIIANLRGRCGFDAAFDVDDDIMDEIKRDMADAIDAHLAQGHVGRVTI